MFGVLFDFLTVRHSSNRSSQEILWERTPYRFFVSIPTTNTCQTMKTLTTLQLEAILIIANNEMHDGRDPVGNPVYSHNWFTKSQAAAVSSCVQAGYLHSFECGKDSTLTLTEAGARALALSGYFFAEDCGAFELAPSSDDIEG
jgi:hypothetical protein